MRRTVIATIQVFGFHRWPTPPAEVAYLAAPHRHVFIIKAFAPVIDSDREIEFHLLQKAMLSDIERLFPRADVHASFNFGANSCEHLAEQFLTAWARLGVHAVEVWEDGENGSRVEV